MIPSAILPILAFSAGAVVAGLGVHKLTSDRLTSRYELRIAQRETDLAQQARKQLEVAHAQTIDMQSKSDAATAAAFERQKTMQSQHAGVLLELDRLRNHLKSRSAAARSGLPSHPANASAPSEPAENVLLAECAAELAEVAREADAHASDSLTLQQAWPRPAPKK